MLKLMRVLFYAKCNLLSKLNKFNRFPIGACDFIKEMPFIHHDNLSLSRQGAKKISECVACAAAVTLIVEEID
jgi:hypothetical protein